MKPGHLKLPPHTEYSMGAFIGRFSSAVIVAAIPEYPLLAVAEIPNYHYVGDGEIELAGMTTVEWGELVVRTFRSLAGREARCSAWVSPDTEFASELRRCKLIVRRNVNHGPELRTEVLREYFMDNQILLMPWLDVLPYEIGRARWPDEAASAYQVRAIGQDYTLAALEQATSRRPKSKEVVTYKATTFLETLRQQRNIAARKHDPHLGNQ
jgi:hypothetical protein